MCVQVLLAVAVVVVTASRRGDPNYLSVPVSNDGQ